MKRHTIGIDFGAAFTKVSYRKPLTPPSSQCRFACAESEVVILDRSELIPSLIINTNNKKQPWLFGFDAAGINPTNEMTVYENWKAVLFQKEPAPGASDLAERFFSWLAKNITQKSICLGQHPRIRIAVPALNGLERSKEILTRSMMRAGWPTDIEIVHEPAANLVGVLSAGRNVISGYGKISYGAMFGDEGSRWDNAYLIREIRRFMKRQRKERFVHVTVIDFGSFTLDVARMAIDLSVTEYDYFPIDDVRQESWKVGITKDLDQHCLHQLSEKHSFNYSDLSFFQRETMKSALYNNREYALHGTIVGKDSWDRMIVRDSIDRYCQIAWDRVSDFCFKSEFVILTGGGVLVCPVREYFFNRLKEIEVEEIISVASNDELDSSLLYIQGSDMARIATALGASSIAFGY